MRLAILATHPIQYQAPFFRALAEQPHVELMVYFGHRPTPEQQGIDFDHAFTWSEDLLDGYPHHWLENVAARPGLDHYGGIDTPGIRAELEKAPADALIIPGWIHRCCRQAMGAARSLGIPFYLRGDSQLDPRHSSLRRWLHRRLRGPLVRQAKGVLPCGERSAQFFRHLGAQRITIVPHTVATETFRRQALAIDPAAARRRWGLPAEAKVVLFAGKLVARKRVHLLLEAFRRVHPPGWSLLIAGDGPLRANLTEAASRNELPVHFTGFLDQAAMAEAYRAADLLVLPSSFDETWGLVVNEAIACGCPALVSDACGCAPEMVRDGVAEAFRWDDATALEDRLLSLLHEDARRADLRRAGAELSRHLSPSAVARLLVERLRDGA